MSDNTKQLWSDEQYAAYELGMQTEREHQNALSRKVEQMHKDELAAAQERERELEEALKSARAWEGWYKHSGEVGDSVIAGQAQRIQELQAEVSGLQERVKELEEQVEGLRAKDVFAARLANLRLEQAQLAQQGEWEPVDTIETDWGYQFASITEHPDGETTLQTTGYSITDPDLEFAIRMPSKYRVCRKVEGAAA